MSLPLVFLYWYMYTNDFIEVVITRKFDRDFLLYAVSRLNMFVKSKNVAYSHTTTIKFDHTRNVQPAINQYTW